MPMTSEGAVEFVIANQKFYLTEVGKVLGFFNTRHCVMAILLNKKNNIIIAKDLVSSGKLHFKS